MNLELATMSPAQQAPMQMLLGTGEGPSTMSRVKLRKIHADDAIALVGHLREEIDLSVHAAAGPQFLAVEKKETSAASSSPSSSMVN